MHECFPERNDKTFPQTPVSTFSDGKLLQDLFCVYQVLSRPPQEATPSVPVYKGVSTVVMLNIKGGPEIHSIFSPDRFVPIRGEYRYEDSLSL